jgi:Domain of unknown function (DUF1707)
MGRDEMRAADADRQAVAERLKAALDEGRLDLHEYDERLQQAYAAKTYGDLEGLLTDLPATVGGIPATVAEDHLTRRWLLHVWSSYIPVVGITTVIWLVSSIAAQDLLYFWPVWVAGPWGVLLIWQTVGGLAQREPQAWQAKIQKAERKKLAKKERKALEAEAIQRGELPEKAKKKSA